MERDEIQTDSPASTDEFLSWAYSDILGESHGNIILSSKHHTEYYIVALETFM